MSESIKIGSPTESKEPTHKLNLGCGEKYMDGWINVDQEYNLQADVYCDIGEEPWPFDDNFFDEVIAAHILEHLGRDQFFHAMKELYRVCKPSAEIGIILPHPNHRVYHNDPDHKHPYTVDTFAMFSQKSCKELFIRTGGRITPYWLFHEVDFDFIGQLHEVLDPNLPPEWKDNYRYYANYYNNVVVESRFKITPVKPFDGKPLPMNREELTDAID